MAATADQKLKTRLMLGLTKKEAQKTKAAGDDVDGLFYLLDQLDAAELAKLDGYLAEWAEVETDNTIVETDGVTLKPAEKRALLIEAVSILVDIGFNFGFYTVGTPEEATLADAD